MHKTIKLNDFYLFIFALWYSSEILYNSTLKNIMGLSIARFSDITTWIVFGLLLVQILFFQTYTKRELLIIVSITIPIVIATVLSGQRTFMSAWMFIVAARNVEFRRIIYAAYKILLIMIPMIVLLCLLGIIDNRILMRGSVRRFSLGFSHPNQLGLRIFQLVACYCYVKWKNGIIFLFYW